MNTTAQLAQYNRNMILSAPPEQLLTMLYDRLILDLRRAEVGQETENWPAATAQLLHAQEIIAELASSLKLDVWEGGEQLLALYTYVTSALISANINRDISLTREAITLLEPLRATWHDAAAQVRSSASVGNTNRVG